MANHYDLFPKKLTNSKYDTNSPESLLIQFFKNKTPDILQKEDKSEEFYTDFEQYVNKTKLYADLLTPREFSKNGGCFDIKSICKFMELFAYLSPSHAYSLQVTFLGIFPFLMSKNAYIKKEAVQTLQKGKLFAFGLSEKDHGSDIYSSETKVQKDASGALKASGKKYYIGNSNCADLISVLAVNEKQSSMQQSDLKNEFMFFALRPKETSAFQNVKKIRTLGVKTAFVGEFEIKDHVFTENDIISKEKNAWNAIFGTVNLGKFYLGFGSIGICEHAFQEAYTHVKNRILYGNSVFSMPHIQKAVIHSFVKILGMKLFSYRAADYLSIASPNDKRYLLFNSVQKAKVSTNGVQVIQQLSECMGAKGFESTTHFETALRDIILIPGLEGSTHINYGIIASFLKNYFFKNGYCKNPSRIDDKIENDYLFNAEAGGTKDVIFSKYTESFEKLLHIENVSIFVKQIRSFKNYLLISNFTEKFNSKKSKKLDNAAYYIQLGKMLSTIVYGQLIAESVIHEDINEKLINLIFEQLIEELNLNVTQLFSNFSDQMKFKTLLKRSAKQIIQASDSVVFDSSEIVKIIDKNFN